MNKTSDIQKNTYVTIVASLLLMPLHGCFAEAATEKAFDVESAGFALAADPYSQCSDILAEGLVAEARIDLDQELAGILLDWYCMNRASGESSSGNGALSLEIEDVLDIGISGGGASSELDLRAYCEATQDPFEASSFTFSAMSKVADSNIVNAWKECMTAENQGLLCMPQPGSPGTVRFEYAWDSDYGPGSLDLQWRLDNANISGSGGLPKVAYTGSEVVYFTVNNDARPAHITLKGVGERVGAGPFMTHCDIQIPATSSNHILKPCPKKQGDWIIAGQETEYPRPGSGVRDWCIIENP